MNEIQKQVKDRYQAWVEWTHPDNYDLMPPPDMLDPLERIFEEFGHDTSVNLEEMEVFTDKEQVVRQTVQHTPNHTFFDSRIHHKDD